MARLRPLAIDLFTGLHGWAEGLTAEGFRVVGFDLEDMCGQFGQPRPEHVSLVIQDVLTLHGSQFRNADLIVASPPCQKYSYMAMPWTRAKALVAWYREDEARQVELNALFNACFRIQREACEAAGRHIPLIVENVRGAQPWVGKARWNFGSYYLFGDVPALMPVTFGAHKVPSFRFDGSGGSFQTASVRRTDVGKGARFTSRDCGAEGVKQSGISGTRNNGKGDRWFQDGAAKHGSKSNPRKAASAMIAKVPYALARHIARTFKPAEMARAA